MRAGAAVDRLGERGAKGAGRDLRWERQVAVMRREEEEKKIDE